MKQLCERLKYRFKLTKAEDGEYVALGKLGLLYEYGFLEYGDVPHIGAMFMPREPQKGWTARRKKLIEAGATVIQNGDLEGTVLIPAKDGKLVRLAAKLLGVKVRRELSAAQRAELGERLKKARAKK